MNGIGTLLFIFITKAKAPAYLGRSFAFLAPRVIVINEQGFDFAQGALVFIGILGMLIAFIIKKFGTKWIDIILPPAAMGSVVSLIGFELVGLTIKGGAIGANIISNSFDIKHLIVFLITLLSAIFGSLLFKKFLVTIPILIAISIGYLSAVMLGMVDFSSVLKAPLFTIPEFSFAKFSLSSFITMLPVILVITSEHILHQVVTSNIIGKDLIKDPGLHRSIFADNFSTALSGLIGGVPTTTYGENIGVMAITKVYATSVIAGAAIISIIMAFIGPISELIRTIPGDVIGGVTFLLYGMIGTSGLRLLVDSKVDYSKTKNLILTSIIFTTGLSGLKVDVGAIQLSGMVLASVVALLLSISIYLIEKVRKSES